MISDLLTKMGRLYDGRLIIHTEVNGTTLEQKVGDILIPFDRNAIIREAIIAYNSLPGDEDDYVRLEAYESIKKIAAPVSLFTIDYQNIDEFKQMIRSIDPYKEVQKFYKQSVR